MLDSRFFIFDDPVSWVKAALLSALFLLLPAAQVSAADITVDSTCSLAQAINEANEATSGTGNCEAGDDADATASPPETGADNIILSSHVTITALLPEITTHVTINGGGNNIFMGNAILGSGPLIATAAGSNLTLNRATLVSGGGGGRAALDFGDSATLKQVTMIASFNTAIRAGGASAVFNFDNIYLTNTRLTWSWPNAIWARSGEFNISNLTIHNMASGADMIRVERGAEMTLSGCRTFARSNNKRITAKGRFTDSSSGACGSVAGNSIDVVVPPAPAIPEAAPCGMPSIPDSWLSVPDNAGLLVYTLTDNCVMEDIPFYIPENVRMLIRSTPGQRYSISTPTNNLMSYLAGELTLRNVDIIVRNAAPGRFWVALSPPGKLLIEDSTIRNDPANTAGFGMWVGAAQVTLNRVTFQDFTSAGHGYSSVMTLLGPSKLTIRDSVFRNNHGGPGAISVYHDLGGRAILLGTNTFDNNTSLDFYDPHALVCRGSACLRQVPRADDDDDYQPAPTPTPAPPAETCKSLPDSIIVSAPTGKPQCQRVGARGIGIASVIERGIIDAVDIWSWLGAGAQVCFRQSSGTLLFLDAATAPRAISELPVYSVDGMICAFIDRPGTVVLVPGPPPPAATDTPPVYQSLSGCMVYTQYALNFRAAPDGKLIRVLPFNVTLTALARTDSWFKVDYYGAQGWISARHVEPIGTCR